MERSIGRTELAVAGGEAAGTGILDVDRALFLEHLQRTEERRAGRHIAQDADDVVAVEELG
jgi:hypothetical protein